MFDECMNKWKKLTDGDARLRLSKFAFPRASKHAALVPPQLHLDVKQAPRPFGQVSCSSKNKMTINSHAFLRRLPFIDNTSGRPSTSLLLLAHAS